MNRCSLCLSFFVLTGCVYVLGILLHCFSGFIFFKLRFIYWEIEESENFKPYDLSRFSFSCGEISLCGMLCVFSCFRN